MIRICPILGVDLVPAVRGRSPLQSRTGHPRQGARLPRHRHPHGTRRSPRFAKSPALLADYQRKSREAEAEAKAIVDQAKREAEFIASETKKSLAEQLERRTKAAEEKIARAEAQAVSEVRASAVDVAITAAERLLKDRVTGDLAASLTAKGIETVKASSTKRRLYHEHKRPSTCPGLFCL